MVKRSLEDSNGDGDGDDAYSLELAACFGSWLRTLNFADDGYSNLNSSNYNNNNCMTGGCFDAPPGRHGSILSSSRPTTKGNSGGAYTTDATTSIASRHRGDNNVFDEEDEKANALAVQEMNALSIKDRELVFEDVHGVTAKIEETPEFVNRCMKEMEDYLYSLPPSQIKSAYDMAESLDANYVHSYKLRIMFLRAERFRPVRAADRLIGWFDWKLQLFGRDRLCQEQIMLQDLHKDAMCLIQDGWQQILPMRDSRGRAVFFCSTFGNVNLIPSALGVMHMFWYSIMSMLEDEETQKSGIIVVNHFMGKPPLKRTSPNQSQSVFSKDHPMYEVFWRAPKMMNFLPMRLDACHFCLDDSKTALYRPLMTLMKLSTDSHHRARMRIHYGSPTECHYALLSFGLPSSVIPIQNDGETVKTTAHLKWLKRRKVKEAWLLQQKQDKNLQGKEFIGVELPSRSDVLLGRGQPINEHSGNRHLHDLIKSFRQEYDTAKGKGKKTAIAKQIVRMIQSGSSHDVTNNADNSNYHQGSGGGRFLKRNEKVHGWWEPVPDEVALEKVCHGFRAKREDRKGTNSGNENSSSTFSNKRMKKGVRQENQHPQQVEAAFVAPPVAAIVPDSDQKRPQERPPSQCSTAQISFGSDEAVDHPDDDLDHDLALGTGGNNDLKLACDKILNEVALVDDPEVLMNLPLVEEDGCAFDMDTDVQRQTERTLLLDSDDVMKDSNNSSNRYAGKGPPPPPLNVTLTVQEQPVDGANNLLHDFIVEHYNCFKNPPERVLKFMRSMDITTLGDLLEACNDTDFVESSMVVHGGLKKFKLGPFVKAVQAAIVCN